MFEFGVLSCRGVPDDAGINTFQFDVIRDFVDRRFENTVFGDVFVNTLPMPRSCKQTPDFFANCSRDVAAPAETIVATAPGIECGYGEWPQVVFRHLCA